MVVVGIGNSAVDLACELSRVSKKVHVSTRTYVIVVGLKFDLDLTLDYFHAAELGFCPNGVSDLVVTKNGSGD